MLRLCRTVLPAGLRSLARRAEPDRRSRLRAVTFAGEREQRVQETRQALDLILRCPQLALELGIVGLQTRSLEAEPQAGERRSKLVRRVCDEVPLRGENLREAFGHVVEGESHLLLLGRTRHFCPCVELSALHPPRRAR